MGVGARQTQQALPARRAALVVGGGLAGMQAALLMAATGVHVYLVDKAPAIGGHQPLLDKTFPTDSCGLCFMSPRPAAYCPFVECERSDYVSILASTEILRMSGEAGDFKVRVIRHARGVDPAICNSCGRCAEACPITVRGDAGRGVPHRKAIYKPFIQAVPDSYLVDWQACSGCGECVKACPAGAVNLNEQDTEADLSVGTVILTPGFKAMDGGLKTEYGYGLYPNVMTSIEVERMLSRGGPNSGEVRRPSDGASPKKIAFIQCVGSRDPASGRNYCSSICCMSAAKQTTLLRSRARESRVTVFQIDLRASGKGYERYVDSVQRAPEVDYRRSSVATVKQMPGTKDLLVEFVAPDGSQREEQFSMVVLSVGVEPSDGVRELAERLGVPVNRYGFIESDVLHHERTSVPGVFVAGGAREPMDVTDAVAEAAAAAASAVTMLGVGLGDPEATAAEVPESVYVESVAGSWAAPAAIGSGDGSSLGVTLPEARAENAPPRIAVLLCDCAGEVGSVVDLAMLASTASRWPGVAGVETVDGLCTAAAGTTIAAALRHTGGNRLVVAACARRRIEERLGRAAESAGLDASLLEMTNLREQCAWVHAAGPAAQSKAETVLSMAVTRASFLEPVEERRTAIPPTALVVGGGVAGITAATELAGHGVEVWLAEKEEQLGGVASAASQGMLADPPGSTGRTSRNGLVHVLTGAEVTSVEGRLGAFRTTIRSNGSEERVDHSIVVLATGVEDAPPAAYLPAGHPALLTQADLGRKLSPGPEWAASRNAVGMLLCGGAEAGYCSRTCCHEAVANSLRIRQQNPATAVYVLHREMRTYAFQEEQYEAARRAGVVFLRYEAGEPPGVSLNGDRLWVTVREPRLQRPILLDLDVLAVATGVAPRPVERLAASLGVPVDQHGFLVEANVKTRSTETVRPGVFLAGACQAPRSQEDTLVHAKGAAMRAFALLRQGHVITPRTLPTVNERICSGCGLCVEACAYGARVLDDEKRVSKLLDALCHGCGGCATACPNGATQQTGFSRKQMIAMLDVAVD